MHYYDGYDTGHMADGWQWLMMGAFWFVLIALIAAAVVIMVRATQHRPSAPTGHAPPPLPDALAILDTRLARGEIDVETYDALRRRLLEARGGL